MIELLFIYSTVPHRLFLHVNEQQTNKQVKIVINLQNQVKFHASRIFARHQHFVVTF